MDEMPALPKRIAGKLLGKLVSVLWKEFVAGGGAVTRIAAGEIQVATIFVRVAASAFADAGFGSRDAFSDFVEAHERRCFSVGGLDWRSNWRRYLRHYAWNSRQ
jgi:hypothetical protein